MSINVPKMPGSGPEKLRVIKGRYNDLYLGNPDLRMHVDAVHATKLEVRDQCYFGDYISPQDGQPKEPKEGVIFANANFRKLLGVVGDGGSVKISGKTFKVEKGRKSERDGEFWGLVANPKHEKDILAYLEFFDRNTGEIAKDFHELGGSAEITTVSRLIADVNRLPDAPNGGSDRAKQIKANQEYRNLKRKILEEAGILNELGEAAEPYLQVSLHGKKDRDTSVPGGQDIVIGTKNVETICDPKLSSWLGKRLSEKFAEARITISEKPVVIGFDSSGYSGDVSKREGRREFGDNYNVIQLEIGRTLRLKYHKEISAILYEIAEEFAWGDWQR